MTELCQIAEECPHCGHESVWDVPMNEITKPIRTCQNCGRKIFICSECEQLNDYGNCDWHENPDGSCECCCGKIPANV